MVTVVAGRRSHVALAAGVTVFYLGLTYLPPFLSAVGAGAIVASFGPPLAFLILIVRLEMVLFSKGASRAASDIGLSRFSRSGMLIGATYLTPLIALFPVISLLTGASLALDPGWRWTLARVVLVNGLTEEVAMRGFVFRHLRESRRFWPAAGLSTLYFAAYHLPLILTEGVVVGLLGVVVAIPLGFLTALVYERGHQTVWGPGLTHAATNGLVMMITLPAHLQPAVSAIYLALATSVSSIIVLSARRSGAVLKTVPKTVPTPTDAG
jgi:membrane protease YdiL (CAAX protease family)